MDCFEIYQNKEGVEEIGCDGYHDYEKVPEDLKCQDCPKNQNDPEVFTRQFLVFTRYFEC
jgi:rubredoxin